MILIFLHRHDHAAIVGVHAADTAGVHDQASFELCLFHKKLLHGRSLHRKFFNLSLHVIPAQIKPLNVNILRRLRQFMDIYSQPANFYFTYSKLWYIL